MKNKMVLIGLFIFPIVTYLIFASAKHNSLFLSTLSKNNKEIPVSFHSFTGEKVVLKDKITVLGFIGSDIENVKGNLFNLNQKIYNKYYGFKDFQIVIVAPEGTESELQANLLELKRITEDMNGWKIVFSQPEEIEAYYKSFNLKEPIDANMGSPNVIIIDKDLNHRGRKGKNKKGEEEYRDSYNTVSAADLHNEMTDDVKIILREYRLALKKNKRKDKFKDGITKQLEENEKSKQ